jgi:hypothetical protein
MESSPIGAGPRAGICSRENDRCKQHRLSSCLHLPFSRLQTARSAARWDSPTDAPNFSVPPCLRASVLCTSP